MIIAPTKRETLSNVQDFLENICAEHNIPALSVAVWHNGQLYQSATGILNIDTGVEATPDSIFQIGSISKLFTASLIMQLVDEGKVSLEKPVKQYLRDFQVADPKTTSRVTVGQLLNHTSGIAGDFLPETSYTEENAIARYVDRCNLLPSFDAPGTRHSYSNAGYCIAGRLIEVVLGCSWFDAVVERIFEPLGMNNSIAHPSQVLRYRAAMGHVANPEKPELLMTAPDCYFPLGWAPAGATISLSAADLILFAKAHMSEGLSQSGQTWLSVDSIKSMQTPLIQLPTDANPFATHWGLGWHLVRRPDMPLILSHGGSVIGQTSMLHVIPEQQLAIAILQNSKNASSMNSISHRLLSEAGIDLIEKNPDMEGRQDLQQYQGTFSSMGTTLSIKAHADGLIVESIPILNNFESLPLTLKLINHTCFAAYSSTGDRISNIIFQDFDSKGYPASLYFAFRLFRRV